jgi:hypothetical protein
LRYVTFFNANNLINKAKSVVILKASKAVSINKLITSRVLNVANIIESAVDTIVTYLNILKNVLLST